MAYYEFNFENPDNLGNKGKIYSTLKNASSVVLVLAILIVLIPLDWNTENGPLFILYNVLLILMVAVPLLTLVIVFSKLAKKYYDYDYFIYGDVLKIVKIINKVKRKTAIDLNLNDVVQIGMAKSDAFLKANENAEKKHDFTCNRYDENPIYILSIVHGQRVLMLCQADDNFMIALHKTLKRESVFDKSIYTKNKQEEEL